MKYYSKVPVLQPAYLKNFACIGGACPDNCCRGRVEIDRETYRLCKSLPNIDEKKRLFECVERDQSKDPCVYAHIKNQPGQPCPLLSDKGLCTMQKAFGEENLFSTCFTVPRRINRIGSGFERSLRLYCPEACGLALMEPGVMEFDSFIGDVSAKYLICTDISMEKAGEIQPAWFEIRSALIDILQDRRLDFGHRLLLAALAVEELEKMNALGASVSEICSFLDAMAADYAHEQAVDELRSIKPTDDAAASRLLQLICGSMILPTDGARDETYQGYVGQCARGLGVDGGPDGLDALRRFDAARAGSFGAYFAERQQIPEHFLVNLLFGRCFPLRNQKSIFNEFIKLMLYAGMMNIMLAGISAESGPLSDTKAIDFIHRFSKLVELEPSFEALADRLIQKEGLGGIQTVMALMRFAG